MAFITKIRKIISLKIIIGGISLLAAIAGLYQFIHEKKPDMSYEVINEANVLDVHKPVDELAVTFQGQNIQQSNLNLKIFTFKIENNGEMDILQGFYDKDTDWGFKVNGGKIIDKIRVLPGNSDYIQSNLNPKIIDSQVSFNKVIFEKNKYVILELLVLHDKNFIPIIQPLGKIAGVDQINLSYNLIQNERQSFFRQSFGGSIFVQLVRLVSYFIILLLILVLFFFIIDKIDDFRKKKLQDRRNEIVEKYVNGRSSMQEGNKSVIFDVYKTQGIKGLMEIISILKEKEKYLTDIKISKLEIKKKSGKNDWTHLHFVDRYYPDVNILIENKIIYEENDKVKLDNTFSSLIHSFVQYLKINKFEY